MDILRDSFDGFYNLIKPAVFKLTEDNPSVAHRLFVNSLKTLELSGLAELVLDNKENHLSRDYIISSAAGFNKNGLISPRIMKLLGFQRGVIGTVTGEPYEGNPEPNERRFPKTESHVNWKKLPGDGSLVVSRRLKENEEYYLPLTINIMPTPGKEGNGALFDLAYTIENTRDIPYVDRFVFNISCPNDKEHLKRMKNLNQLSTSIGIIRERIYPSQELYIKISPDLNQKSTLDLDQGDVYDIVKIGEEHGVDGYVTTNTTAKHDPKYITEKMEEGGASGNAIYEPAKRMQKYFADIAGKDVKLIASGGINSVERMYERLGIGNCSEVQIFTPLIFKGTGLLRKLRRG